MLCPVDRPYNEIRSRNPQFGTTTRTSGDDSVRAKEDSVPAKSQKRRIYLSLGISALPSELKALVNKHGNERRIEPIDPVVSSTCLVESSNHRCQLQPHN
jgi:hypothetical protein